LANSDTKGYAVFANADSASNFFDALSDPAVLVRP
jgi:hypothetical protein